MNKFSIDASGGDVSNQLVGLGGMIGKIKAQKQEKQAMEDKAAADAELKVARDSAVQDAISSGDKNKMLEVMAQYPEMKDVMEQSIGFASDETKGIFDQGAAAFVATGDLGAIDEAVDAISQRGGTPANLAYIRTVAEDDPERAKNLAKMYLAGSNKDMLEGLDSGEPEQMTEYQRAMMDYKKIDQDLRREESELKRLEAQRSAGTSELKKRELEAQIEERKRNLETTQKEKSLEINTELASADSLVGEIDAFLKNDDYLDVVSGVSGSMPTMLPSSKAAVAAFENIVDNLTLGNLDKMSGVLTDRDIGILKSAASKLRAGTPKEVIVAELKAIKEKIMAKADAKRNSLPSSGEPSQGGAAKTKSWGDM